MEIIRRNLSVTYTLPESFACLFHMEIENLAVSFQFAHLIYLPISGSSNELTQQNQHIKNKPQLLTDLLTISNTSKV